MSTFNYSFHKTAATKEMNYRHKPLHASGVSILAMANIAYRKSLEFPGPLGSIWRKMANYVASANPLVYAIQCHMLAILSFWDDHIIVVEKMMEKLFPTSAILFNKIDDVVLAIMLLPPKFNDALNKFSEIIHRIPFMECVLFYVISWFNCLISTFNRWGLENSSIKEKKIDVNTINDEELEALNHPVAEIINNESKESSISASESEASEGVSRGADIEAWARKRGLYNEEHSQKKKSKKKRKEFQSQKIAKDKEDESEHAKTNKFWRPKIVKKEKDEEDGSVQVKYEVRECGRMIEEDPILGLFESGWTMKNMT